MKFRIIAICLFSSLFLVACSSNDNNDTTKAIEEENVSAQTETEEKNVSTQTVTTEETTESSNDADFKTIIDENLGEGDEITQFSNEGNVIQVTIKLAEHDLLEPTLLAENAYRSIGESLLPIEDWETLTINFENVGEISFNRNEAKENEYGAYFESEEIIKRLSKNK